MPGASPVTRTISLHATGSLTYRLRSEWSGSDALARTLELTLTDSTGRVMYRGPFDAAHVGDTGWETASDLRLADDQVESIAVGISLPLSQEMTSRGLGCPLISSWKPPRVSTDACCQPEPDRRRASR